MKPYTAAALVFAISMDPCAWGQAGALDPSFGTNGITTNSMGVGVDRVFAMAIQPDGRIISAGSSANRMAVARYTTNGSLDTTFASGGILTTTLGSAGSEIRAVVVQPDGRILLAGTAAGYDSLGAGPYPGIALVRLNVDGAFDPTFGTGGSVITAMATSASGAALSLLADGRILVGGTTGAGFMIARYNTDGTLDGTFGAGGMAVTPMYIGEAYAMAVQSDGRILLSGQVLVYDTANLVGTLDYALVRYDPDGALDNAFGINGRITTDLSDVHHRDDYVRCMTVQPDGRIIVAGFSVDQVTGLYSFGLVRYEADGTLDGSFGTGGVMVHDFGGNYLEARGIALQPDGRILVAGCTWSDFALARYNTDGTLDNSFDGDGRLVTDIGASYDYGSALALQADGKIVVAGYTSYFCADRDFAVIRYQNDISTNVAQQAGLAAAAIAHPDPTTGIVTIGYTLENAAAISLDVRDAQGRIVHGVLSRQHRTSGSHQETIDLSALPAGQYTLLLASGTWVNSVKVIKR